MKETGIIMSGNHPQFIIDGISFKLLEYYK